MKKKLTLVIEESVIEQAKRLARYKQTSVSEIVEKYFIGQVETKKWQPQAGSIVGRLVGSSPSNSHLETIEDELETVIRDKYA